MTSVYLGGPEVFFPDLEAVFRAKIQICTELGFTPALPGDGKPANFPRTSGVSLKTISTMFYAADMLAMLGADIGVFDLTPFRGVSADSGTVLELGFMAGLKKPVFGYTNIGAPYIERVSPRTQEKRGGQLVWVDDTGCTIEDYGNFDNLMLEGLLQSNGNPVVRNFNDPPRCDPTYYDAFKTALQRAKQVLSASPPT